MKGSGSDSVMRSVIISLMILLCVAVSAAGVVGQDTDQESSKAERTVATDASVTVTLCVMSGQITVRGWDKNEVRASSADAERIELRRVDLTGDETKPPKKIDVFIDDHAGETRPRGDCQASADVELNVPRGATVQVQTRDGDIQIVGVEAAYAGSQNGDICIERVAQKIEAGSIGGSISVKDSSGRVSLSSAGGSIEAINVKPVESNDNFEVVSVSGDIQLDQVSNVKLTARSVTGNISLTGSLRQGGLYGFNTMSGDVTLSLPSEASFRLHAKLSHDGEIISDFPLTITPELTPMPKTPEQAPVPETPKAVAPPPPAAPPATTPGPTPPVIGPKVKAGNKNATVNTVTVVKVAPAVVKITPAVVAVPYRLRRVNAVCGSGDASINVSSFSGTLRLQKS